MVAGKQISKAKAERIFCELKQALTRRGFRAGILSLGRVQGLIAEIETRRERGEIDHGFYDESLSSFDPIPPKTTANAESVIVVAASQPEVHMTFRRRGESYRAVIPPTYSHRIDASIRALLAVGLQREGFSVTPAVVPKKAAAVASGIALYGRNNLTYVDDLGSFFRLATFFSDLPCPGGSWEKPRALDLCHDCTACLKHCPTGAVSSKRFLIHADRCLTFHNERTAEFPSWVDPTWHNCLIGCMACQDSCPVDRQVTKPVAGSVTFSAKETEKIIEGRPLNQLPVEKRSALVEYGLADDSAVLPRNLDALLKANRA